MPKLDFPDDFVWGTATASYQVEGAGHEGGRSECIWDTFSRIPGAVYGGENGEIACDQYHRYREDIALMAELGFKSYRFSIAWPRVIPAGTGKVNPEGIAYYRALCDELHKNGIKACATIYHWDLPQVLQDKGGWADRSIVEAFTEYAKVCFAELGKYVDQWITINEPFCVTYLGYYYGVHAPGIRDIDQAIKTVHHVNLAHGSAVKAYRKTGLTAPIGITWNPSTPRPATKNRADKKAALTARALETEVFIYPVLGKGYPDIVTRDLGLTLPVKPGDLETIAQPIDFIGVNYYNESPVAFDKKAPFKYSSKPSWQETSEMGWPTVPQGLARQLRWIQEVSGGIPMYITENGYARNDEVDAEGRVHDRERIHYVRKHLEVCRDLIKEGINLKGYYAWSFADNFEWAYGYTKRFGIVYVDYTTQKRYPKDSAYFFRDVIAGYGEW
ncbi:MAG: beta-glucosidase [Spirochaetaceae bacterium]|jgi:beta-glucosidase|nr:beta-glucosidase [Spirochaetaceae bacterium]